MTLFEISRQVVPPDCTIPAIESKCRQMSESVINNWVFSICENVVIWIWLHVRFIKTSGLRCFHSEQAHARHKNWIKNQLVKELVLINSAVKTEGCQAENKVAAVGIDKLGWETACEQNRLQLLLQVVFRDGAEVKWSGRQFQVHQASIANSG